MDLVSNMNKRSFRPIAALGIVLIGYFSWCKLYAEPKAKNLIIAEMRLKQENRCGGADIKGCKVDRDNYIECKEEIFEYKFDYWWNNKYKENIENIIYKKYIDSFYDFKKVKYWMACEGFMILKSSDSMNISSPSYYGYSLFDDDLFWFAYRVSLDVREEPDRKIKVRIGFTYL
ncbi:hypothetical protein RvVAT039_32880 [Agrobacterium vitis]|nr:hypothetical protein RvVAT039_32880 [Agrobacterium vitis]